MLNQLALVSFGGIELGALAVGFSIFVMIIVAIAMTIIAYRKIRDNQSKPKPEFVTTNDVYKMVATATDRRVKQALKPTVDKKTQVVKSYVQASKTAAKAKEVAKTLGVTLPEVKD